MNSNKSKKQSSILGVVTVNEKGQVVIPADARAAIDLKSGDKLLVMNHKSHEGLVLIKPDSLEQIANQMLEKISAAKSYYKEKKASE